MDLAIAALVRGLSPEQLDEEVQRSYRELARAKQLPPDTPGWDGLLARTGDDQRVSLVTPLRHPETQKPVLARLDTMSPEQRASVADFFLWFILAGRGFGKSWVGSNWINEGAERATGEHMAIMGRDAHDVRFYCVEGDSGVLATARNDFYPKYEPSKRLITWPNGVKAKLFYAEEPNTVRGPNNFRAWCDEPASYQDAHLGLKGPNGEDTAMSNLLMTLRKGSPQLLVTGTPKPLKLVKDLMNYVGAVIVRGGTRENITLAPRWLKEMEDQYAGTRLGRQELDGEVLDDNPGALWRRAWIESQRVSSFPELERIVVAVDPAASDNKDPKTGKTRTGSGESAETGIIVGGRWWHPGEQRYHYYVVEDRTTRGSPNEWATVATQAYHYHRADRIVAERNNGGDMVEATLLNADDTVTTGTVWASRGKHTRAEPVSALYEQGRVHHVGRDFVHLEDQLCEWEPGMPSPDRLDALVWLITELMEAGSVTEDEDQHGVFFDHREGDFHNLTDLGRLFREEDN